MRNIVALNMIALCLFVFLNLTASADDNYELKPRCGGFFGLCGYADAKSKKILIPLQFERAYRFSEGLAAVKIKGKFGFINSSGDMVIRPKFDLVGPFSQGLAEVLVGDVVGVIDRSGNYVVKPQFARAIPFTSDTLLVAKGKWRSGYYSRSERLEDISTLLPGLGNRGLGLYSLSTGWLTEPVLKVKFFDDPSRGLIWATAKSRYKGQFGLLRSDGTWQVEPTYTHVQRLYEGLAVVRGKSVGKNFYLGNVIDPFGAVDRDGKLVIPLKYDYLSFWRDGYSVVKRKGLECSGIHTSCGLQGLVNPDGTLLGGRYFSEVERPKKGGLARVRDDQTWYSIKPNGTLVKDENEGVTIAKCPSGLSIREVSGRAQFSHSKLAEPHSLLFDRKHRFSQIDCEKPVPVSLNDKWAFMRQDGRLITNPPSFSGIDRFKNGVAAVSLNGLWGIIDENGLFVVKPAYDHLRPVPGNFYKVKKGDREFWIDASGKEVSKPKPTAEERYKHLTCRNGTKIFTKNRLYGIRTLEGKILVQPKYRAINCFYQGVAWAAFDEKKQWCPLGVDGEQINQIECVDGMATVQWIDSAQKPLHPDRYESSVLWNRWYREFGLGITDTKPETGYPSF